MWYYNCAQRFKTTCLKFVFFFATSLENCLIYSFTLLFMLEERCYVTDVSITTFKNELFNDLVVLEARIFNIIARFAAENMGKNFFCGVDRSKIVTLHEKGY